MIRSVVLVLAAALLALPAAAQTAREAQIPLDPERGILEVTAELRRELGLYEDVPGFQAARLFRLEDGTLVLEVSCLQDGRLVRDRERVDEARLAALRSDLAGRLGARGQLRLLDRSGRSVLVETILGLGFYGWAVPVGFDIDSATGGRWRRTCSPRARASTSLTGSRATRR